MPIHIFSVVGISRRKPALRALFPLPGKLFSLKSLPFEIVSIRYHYGAPVLDCGIDYDNDNAAAMLLLSKDSDA